MKIIQLLNWKLESIEKELDTIKKQGFDAVQINPMQPFKSQEVFKWWLSYQPLGFRVGNVFGTKEDLKKLCQKAKEKDIKIIVDVVLNHTANKSNNEPCIPHETVDPILRNNKKFWKESCLVQDYSNRKDAVTHCIGLPGLDLNNIELQKIIFNYLDELVDCGVSGFRFDAAKHIGLPNDGVSFFEYVRIYLELHGLYGYGEILGGTKEWNDEMSKYIYVHMPAGNQITYADLAVVFGESHDTYLNDKNNTRNLDNNLLICTYNFLRLYYQNTLVYVRPLDENGPYCKNIDNLTFDEVLKLNEKDYFTDLYFNNDNIRKINNNILTINDMLNLRNIENKVKIKRK